MIRSPVGTGGAASNGDSRAPKITDDGRFVYFESSANSLVTGDTNSASDVFQADLAKNGEATNLGKPVNTEKDDFAFTFNQKRKVGFLSSNRGGNDDIFIVSPICGVQVATVVTDAVTGNILAGASVSIIDEKRNVIFACCVRNFEAHRDLVEKLAFAGTNAPVGSGQARQAVVETVDFSRSVRERDQKTLDLPLQVDSSGDPARHRMEYQHRLQNTLDNQRPIVPPGEVRRLMQADLFQLVCVELKGQPIGITVSIGVAPVRTGDLVASVNDADDALYVAKGRGRNQVAVAASDAARSASPGRSRLRIIR